MSSMLQSRENAGGGTSVPTSSLLAGRKARARREALTAYLFLLPAVIIILMFGLWPVLHALYVSLHKWNIKPRGSQCLPYWLSTLGLGSTQAQQQTDCLGLSNYVELLGVQSVRGVFGLLVALALGTLAYSLWKRSKRESGTNKISLGALAISAVLALAVLVYALPALLASGEWTYLVSIGLVLLGWLVWKGAGRADSTLGLILRLISASSLVGGAVFFFFVDFQRMWDLGSQELWKSLIYTVFYSAGTVPIQLALSLTLAYILFQGVRGQGIFRLFYFMPYIAPSVATAVVFRRIFSLRDTGLMNELLKLLGLPAQKWLSEAKAINPLILDVINQRFGAHLTWPSFSAPLDVVLSGPSLALVSIIIYNWWVFVGYDTVIYLAGLGNIPTELYEAAKIDGAGRWSLFRRITIPLLSPTTFFLTIIATIGTFNAFNHIWMMQEQGARDTVDTASILIFRTFSQRGQYGEAAAMAFILFGIILVLSQIQNRIGEKLVFYG
jgi:multiple sugar transport system permease protein